VWRWFYFTWLLVTVTVYLIWDGGDLFRSHDYEGELRRQFHIPAGSEIVKVHRPGRAENRCSSGGIITGEVHFTNAAYRSYLAGLSDRSIWRPTPLHHFSDDIRDYHFDDEALDWHPVGRIKPSEANVPFYNNNAAFESVGPGQLLCYAIEISTRDLFGTPKGAGYSGMTVMACDTTVGVEAPKSWVVGFLDETSRTLKMRIQLANPPQYCARARRRPLMEGVSKNRSESN
jgi:hypothetical protein